MRVSHSCLVAAVVLIGCAHGGFVTGGIQNVWPALDEDVDLAGVAGSIGGGVALRGAGGDDSHPTYLEGWFQRGEVSSPGLIGNVTTAGVGVRFSLADEGIGRRSRYSDLYFRFGSLYQHGEGGKDGWGGYAGMWYNIYINEARTLSVAPEILVGGLFRDGTGGTLTNLHAAAGVTLIWRFGGSSKKSTSR